MMKLRTYNMGWAICVAVVWSVSGGCGGKNSDGTALAGTGASSGAPVTGGAANAGTSNSGSSSDNGGTGTTVGGCNQAQISAAEATALYTAYAFVVQPDLNPSTKFVLEELRVDGLWESLQTQLFNAKGLAEDATVWRECSIMYHECNFVEPTLGCGGSDGQLLSGLVANGAFYYSWGFGSGIYRSMLGKLSPGGTTLARVVSPAYTNGSMAPPPLVLERIGTAIAVRRANTTAFNVWATAQSVGTLKDYGDRLAIVDETGQEVPTTIP